MNECSPAFDCENVFDEDYLHFHDVFTRRDASVKDADLICRLLEARPGEKILDLACGFGRIAERLAERNLTVFGLDRSRPFIRRARASARGLEPAPAYVRGDMRSLPYIGAFDSVVSWFASFGYFDDETDREVLKNVLTALVPGGRLLLEHANREQAIARTAYPTILTKGDDLLIDQSRYNATDGRLSTQRVIVRNGAVRRVKYALRLYTYTEIRDWLLAAGFGNVEGYGHECEPFDVRSRRMIILATKPG